MDILCGGCGKTLKVGDDSAGTTVRCPHCGHGIRVPDLRGPQPGGAEEDVLTPLRREEDLADEFLTKARLALKKKLLVQCGSCGERLTVQQRLAGKVARCPACGEPIRIPTGGDDQAAFEGEDFISEEVPAHDGLDIAETRVLEAPGPAGEPARPAASRPGPEAVPAALADAVTRYRSRRAEPAPAPTTRRTTFVLLAALIAGAACIGAGFLLWGRGGQPAEPPAPNTPAGAPPVSVAPGPPGPVTPIPPTPAPVPPTHPIASAPAVQPALTVIGAQLRILGGDGLVPAPLGKAFLEVSVELTAGQRPLAFDPAGGAVTLDTAEGKFLPLGLTSSDSLLPTAARNRPVSLQPGASGGDTFVFLVPADLSPGVLRVAGAGQADVTARGRAAPRPPGALAGTYTEAGRYLRLAFDNPLLEQLRTAPQQRLVVRGAGNRFDLAFSPAGLNGQAGPSGDGTYLAVLGEGSDRVSCRLRLSEDGSKAILYLADKPFHQIVYERQPEPPAER